MLSARSFHYWKAGGSTKEVLHIANHWNWEGHEGKEIPLLVHSNAEKVALLLNGKKVAEKAVEPSVTHNSQSAGMA